jgi:hypothetical protein
MGAAKCTYRGPVHFVREADSCTLPDWNLEP